MAGKIGETLRKAADLDEENKREMEIKNTQIYIWIVQVMSIIADYIKVFMSKDAKNVDTFNETKPPIFKTEKERVAISKMQEEAKKPLYERNILTDTELWD